MAATPRWRRRCSIATPCPAGSAGRCRPGPASRRAGASSPPMSASSMSRRGPEGMTLDDLPPGAPHAEPVLPRVDRPQATVQKITRAEELRLQLADEIVRGGLRPGAPLDETDIARRFNVSRTPVREALRQ